MNNQAKLSDLQSRAKDLITTDEHDCSLTVIAFRKQLGELRGEIIEAIGEAEESEPPIETLIDRITVEHIQEEAKRLLSEEGAVPAMIFLRETLSRWRLSQLS